MDYPNKINYNNLKDWIDSNKQFPQYQVIQSKDLHKVAGGLYRIRDDYQSVWSMKEDEDGRSYIVRADDDSDRMYVAEDSNENSSRNVSAFRTFTAGQVHVVWECDDCKFSNITKEGEGYECGQCHTAYDDVFGQNDVLPAGIPGTTVTEAVASYGPHVGEMMRKYAISRIDKDLAELWNKTAAYYKCESCGHDYVSESSGECPRCNSPEVKRTASHDVHAIWPFTKKQIDPNMLFAQIPWYRDAGSTLTSKSWHVQEKKKKKEAATIEQFRKIVSESQMGKIDGVKVDLYTASAVVKVYGALSPQNQEKLMSLPIKKMVNVVWKLIK